MLMIFASCNAGEKLVVKEVKCENLHNPLGIDKTVPRFIW